jgi:preprotein translocase subunit SecD
MSRRTLSDDRRRRKLITALWVFVMTAAVIVLIYREMSAVLYILATLGVTVLLLLVAMSDLAHADGTTDQSLQSKDSSTAADKLG